MDADQIDLGGKFSDESDSFVGWNSTREEMGIRREQETDVWGRYTPSWSIKEKKRNYIHLLNLLNLLNLLLIKYQY